MDSFKEYIKEVKASDWKIEKKSYGVGVFDHWITLEGKSVIKAKDEKAAKELLKAVKKFGSLDQEITRG